MFRKESDLMFKVIPLLCLMLTAAFGAELPVLLQATNSSESFVFGNDFNLAMAVHQDTILTLSSYFAVFKETDGQYFNVAEVSDTEVIVSLFNNGKWLGGQLYSNRVALFQLDAENSPVNQTSVNTGPYATLLSDSTILAASDSGFSSFVFQENNSTWPENHILNFDGCSLLDFPSTSVWIDDNMIICYNATYFTYIFTHQANSWMQTDSFQFNVSLAGEGRKNLYSNGEDTVVFAFPDRSPPGSDVEGYLVIYTKVNGDWVLQVITGEEFGFSTASNSYLGARSFARIDQDTLLFGAPYALPQSLKRGGGDISQPTGLAVIIQRRSNVWTPVVRISSSEVALLGVAVGVSEDNIIVTVGVKEDSHYITRFFTAPRSSIPAIPPVAAPIVPPSTAPEAVVPSASTPTKTPVTKSVSGASALVGYSLSALLFLCLC